jgi:branched-chain amino acid transport system ATP-binding protein
MTATAPLLLQARGMHVRYGVAHALFDVSLDVAAGSVVAVVGPNGAGKSTVARALTGLIPLSKGSITLDGRDITRWAPHRIRNAGVVHLPEGRGVFPALTVMENLRMAASTLPSRDRKDAVERGLEIFPPLAQRRRQAAGLLSGGEQQMLSLARALILSPRLVIADEMSLGLAPKMVDLVFDSLQQARSAGVGIVLIEQFVHRALALADACVVLQRGTAAWSGPASAAKDEILRRYLGAGAA